LSIRPWEQPGADGAPVGLAWQTLVDLVAPAIAIALLGAIESLLCAVVSDSMIGTRTGPNRELIGQGIGNVVAPFFAGIPATAALARTATNVRTGAAAGAHHDLRHQRPDVLRRGAKCLAHAAVAAQRDPGGDSRHARCADST